MASEFCVALNFRGNAVDSLEMIGRLMEQACTENSSTLIGVTVSTGRASLNLIVPSKEVQVLEVGARSIETLGLSTRAFNELKQNTISIRLMSLLR